MDPRPDLQVAKELPMVYKTDKVGNKSDQLSISKTDPYESKQCIVNPIILHALSDSSSVCWVLNVSLVYNAAGQGPQEVKHVNSNHRSVNCKIIIRLNFKVLVVCLKGVRAYYKFLGRSAVQERCEQYNNRAKEYVS